MKTRSVLKFSLVGLLLAAPFVYLYFIYDQLPDQVALHFDSNSQPDRFGPKSELWLSTSIMMGIAAFTYILITNIYSIDPKSQKLQSKTLIEKMSLSVVVLLSLLSLYIIYSSYNTMEGRLLFLILGLFFAFLGNLLHSVKPNYFIGIRLPWTLDNDENWRLTHQLASKMWVVGGCLIGILAIFLPVNFLFPTFFAGLFIMILVPCIYSFRLFKLRTK